MKNDTGKLELALGAFIACGIGAIMVMVVYMTGGVSFSDDTYKVVVAIENIGDLKRGAPVKLGGVEIGTVDNIFIADEDIHIIAGIQNQRSLRVDCTASVATSGLVGDSFLEISKGKSDHYLRKAKDVAEAAQIKGISQAGMGEIMDQVQKIGADVQVLVGNINKLIGNEKFRSDIESTVSNVNDASKSAKELIAGLKDELAKVDKAIASIVKVAGSAEKTMGTVDSFVTKTIGDPKQVNEINQTITNISEIAAALSKNREFLISTLKNVSSATGNIARVTSGIDPHKGILRLLTDEQAGQELLTTIKNLQTAANSVATIGLADLLADQLAAKEIFQMWQKEHKFNSADAAATAWKKWMANQKRVDSMIIRGYSSTPTSSPMIISPTVNTQHSTGSLSSYGSN